MLATVHDVVDIPKLMGAIVLGRRVFLIATPTLPNFLMKHHKEPHKKEAKRCKLTENEFAKQVNRIAKDPARSTHTSLFVLPDGHAFANDFVNSDASPSLSDKSARILMHQLQTIDSVGKDEQGIDQTVTQNFFPDHWILRLLHKSALSSELTNKDEGEATLASFFSGMAVFKCSRCCTNKIKEADQQENGVSRCICSCS